MLDTSGYASAGRSYLRASLAAGLNVHACDRSRSANLYGKGIDQPILDLYERLSGSVVSPDCPAVQHTVPDAFFLDRTSRRPIGYSVFEMCRVPPTWVLYCNMMGEIWTASEYSRQAFLSSGLSVPVHVLPHAIDIDLFSPDSPAWKIENRRRFAFLSILDMTSRKAWHELLRAFWSAFSKDDDVCLVLKCYFGGFSDHDRVAVARRIAGWKRELDLGEGTAPVLLYTHPVDGTSMPSFYRGAGDCYVSIAREGFGLPMAEAMACGLPCIGPEVGGTREFMDESNSLLVKYEGDGPIDPEMLSISPSFEGLRWANHSWEHLAEQMKRMVSDSELRKSLAPKGKATVREKLSFETIGKRMRELLEA